MPWVAPKTDFVNGDVLTATQMNNIGGDLAMFNGGTTGQVLSKASNANGDFAWTSETDPNAIPKTLIDAKGDVITATAADTPARIAVGTNGQVLTADSTTATGLKWSTPASGGLTLLSTTSLTGTSVAINSISQSYKNLFIYVYHVNFASSDVPLFKLRNGTTNLTQSINGVAAGVASQRTNTSATAYFTLGTGTVNQYNAGVNHNSGLLILNNYSSTTVRKPIEGYGGYQDGSGTYRATQFGGYINDVSAVDSIVFESSGNVTINGGTIEIWGGN